MKKRILICIQVPVTQPNMKKCIFKKSNKLRLKYPLKKLLPLKKIVNSCLAPFFLCKFGGDIPSLILRSPEGREKEGKKVPFPNIDSVTVNIKKCEYFKKP